MNILLANSSCKIGGVSTFLLSLRAELLANGHACSMFFFEHGDMDRHLPPDADVQFGSLADCLRLVATRGIQVVHANNVDWHTGISAVRRLGATLLVTAHKVREPAWTYGWHAGNCDAFVAVSQWIRDELQPFTDIPIRVVPNGIDITTFTPAHREAGGAPIVAWVGRGSAPRKRLEYFAALAPVLAQAGFRIWVIDQQGPAQFARIHADAARQLEAAAEVWHGVPFEEMPTVYQHIAASGGCLVSTASMEGLPLALLEAQASGCLVVGADVRGVRECVSPAHGGTLYPADAAPDAAAAVIRVLLEDQDGVRARQQRTASHVRARFSLQSMTNRYLEEYTHPQRRRVRQSAALRWRQTPLVNWRGYVDDRLGVGYAQYEAARLLHAQGHDRVAAAAAEEGLRTAPTMYLHPQRLRYLIRQHLRGRRPIPPPAQSPEGHLRKPVRRGT